MPIEDVNLLENSEGGNTKEVSEKDKKKIQEDGKKSKKIKKQIKDQQIKGNELALFLSKILGRYYNNSSIINGIHNLLAKINETEKILYIIFNPFLDKNTDIKKVSEYIKYIKINKIKITKQCMELIYFILEQEKIGGKTFWNNIKNGKTNITYSEFKEQILKELSEK